MSDTHTNTPVIPEGDVFVHCGDWSKGGKMEETVSFSRWIQGLPHPHKIITPGNHERCIDKPDGDKLLRMLAEHATVLLGTGAEVGGLKVWGSPMTNPFGHDWAFNMPSHIQRVHWRSIPEDLDLLVTHGPPWGVLDRTWGSKSAGSSTLRERLEELGERGPKIHAFGHIHECGGYTLTVDGRLNINAAVSNLFQQIWIDPLVVDYEKGTWRVLQEGREVSPEDLW